MRRLPIIPKLALFGVMAGCLFALLTLVVPNETLLPVMNALCIGIVGAVTVAYAPLMLRAFRDHAFDRVSQLISGMFLMWFSLLGSRGASLYINITGDSASVVNSPVVTFLAYMAIIGGVLHVSGPGTVEQEWKYDRRGLMFGAIAGTLLAIAALFLQYHYLGH
jgi:hypothetical protein